MSTNQKALLLNEKHGKFSVNVVPVEKPGPGEILNKVQAAALNHVDWKIQKWNVLIAGYPAVLGSDIAGDVEEVGEGVLDFKKGDRVYHQAEFKKTRGASQQYVVSLAATTSKISSKLTYDDVSTLPMAITTAYSGLYSAFPTSLGFDAPISKATQGKNLDTPIFVLGGSSSVGQFARLSGFSPIIATASVKHTDPLKELGDTHILDRNLSKDTLKAEIKKITTKPINFAFDSIADGTQQTAVNILVPGGREIAKTFAGVRMPHNPELMEAFYHDNVYGFLENGYITPNRVEVLPDGLAGIPDGLARLETYQVSRLKLVAHPQDD